MPKINVLPKEIAELIAAGEVVERPASVVKELVENSIDAGATRITVEINNGGITFIRITDNGCGIVKDDVPLAFLRHATSKISTAADLEKIASLGFRGEALAATATVSKVEIFTKSENEDIGTHYKIEGGIETQNEESGCPNGTTIVVRDLFYNTPARMKFLKKDVSEASAVTAVIEKAALSHPEISFKLIKDNKQILQSAGDGKLHSAIYSVLGRDFASGLIETNTNLNGVDVNGYICKPVNCRASRAGQHTFLNGRPIVSGTVCAAVEQAYKNSTMVGKFPAFVLFVNMPYDAVDVNVHPAKTQVRFSEEKRVFDAVYAAVKNALNAGDTRPEIAIGKPTKKADFFVNMTTEQYRQQSMDINKKSEVKIGSKAFTDAIEAFLPPLPKTDEVKSKFDSALRLSDNKGILFEREDESTNLAQKESKNNIAPTEKSETAEGINEVIAEKSFNEDEVKYIGEAFNTYIIVQYEENVYIIDKHASHERIIFNKLKSEETISSQTLIMPTTVTLNESEYNAAINGIDTFLKFGFEIEDFGNMSVIVRAIPSMLAAEDVSLIVTQAAENLASGCLSLDKMDDIYHSIACKAAIKGGNITSATELLNLAKKVLSDKNVMYCPHGRPVAFTLSKKHIEKQFGRIQ